MIALHTHRTGTIALGFALVVLPALAGCGRDAAPEKPRQGAAQQARQAIDAATAAERRYQAGLARGDLASMAECNASAPEVIRLVEMSTDGSQGYSLAMTADARGAVAIWQGLLHAKDGKYQGYGPQGMRLDVNGWRQVRQLVVEIRDATTSGDMLGAPTREFMVFCLDGKRGGVDAATQPDAFEAAAVHMRRLGGNYYSPPSHQEN
jgi:hypothetical protein